MRQGCNSFALINPERLAKLMGTLLEQRTVRLTPDNCKVHYMSFCLIKLLISFKALQDLLQISIESREDCPVCLEAHNPIITHCGHSFGLECILRVIEAQHKCPLCRAELADDSCIVHPANDYGDDAAAQDDMDPNGSSTKLDALIGILDATRRTAGNKTVVFSQWCKFLDLVQARLDEGGFKYCRLDGTMSAQNRDKALRALENDPDCTVMLASLGVCSVGLNLVSANKVILSDSWWSPVSINR